LSVLELSRMGFIRVYQSDPTAPLYLETIKTVSLDVVSRVQEFDSVESEATANTIMAQAESDLRQVSLNEEASEQIDMQALENDQEVMAVEAGELE
jgi:hypothetical protein